MARQAGADEAFGYDNLRDALKTATGGKGVDVAFDSVGGETFDGDTETAIFPGDLPENPAKLIQAPHTTADTDPLIRFVRFRPPRLERTAEGLTLSLPHIRLDRALQFLMGDRLA